ncbi:MULTISPECIES: bifunctional glucose-1-phosphatase/inositol phosphatase [unclassified Tatumella]|uniref:bifunctional glucose-1-phosphatase/inositol phosphatase n=1 Tax=unclassified Tatumella TaxID=2649542 RepID=UPI001BAEABD0|nr:MULTISPECIES: bifunctional glucose-1-phosphatase/inositol phosphatase [unclassified Tatumella]MBS0878160.1 bifunctional glucose-1-phosphatase/inositol phosphatase [Tatumella sp. JGM82]MBS0889866.1 bifunctional glucose-1-phosphatase/inositol phosphatase [Tatumella sp. JGM94]MBS0902873.1 bifunctional glucose-1-phosphatase/inositol phosphatase [Tatumella sp. JGM100]
MIKKLSLCTLAVLAALPVSLNALAEENGMQLEQVLMLSRHNLRAPLANGGSILEQSASRSWPQWDVAGGELTTRGGVLEAYMGKYTHDWLARQGVIDKNQCPNPASVFVYANSLQRTVATAQFFVSGAFPGCDIAITHQDAMGTMDPVFNPVITNGSAEFKKAAIEAMVAAEKQQQSQLQGAYSQLNKVADFANAPLCKGKEKCSPGSMANTFSIEKGKEPSVDGPLKIGNALVDAFTLQYYQGFPADQVAWGQIKTPDQWKALSEIKNAYQDILFTTPPVAHDVAAPLVDYIRSQLIDQDKSSAPVFTFMVGHDSNIASLLADLKVKPYQLPGQYEQTPIGGQLVFERWHDKNNNKDLLKIEYVYQSTQQLRDAEPLSLSHPPQRVTLQLEGCPTDSNGYCAWSDFATVLNTALQGTAMQPHMATTDTPAAAGPQPKDGAVTTAAGTAASAQPAAEKPAKRSEPAPAQRTSTDATHASGAEAGQSRSGHSQDSGGEKH